jgi:hypothetical protein
MVHTADVISESTKKPANNYEAVAMDLYMNKGGHNNYPDRLRQKIAKIQQERVDSD